MSHNAEEVEQIIVDCSRISKIHHTGFVTTASMQSMIEMAESVNALDLSSVSDADIDNLCTISESVLRPDVAHRDEAVDINNAPRSYAGFFTSVRVLHGE